MKTTRLFLAAACIVIGYQMQSNCQTEFWKLGTYPFQAESLYIGASFIYYDKEKPIEVWKSFNEAQAEGTLYFMVPGVDTAYKVFTNKQVTTKVNLTDIFSIPVGTELFFLYKVTAGQIIDGIEIDSRPSYTGQNRPGVDKFVTEKTGNTGFPNPYGRRWSVAGRIKRNAVPTDTVEFAFEDFKDFDFNDIIFRVRGLGFLGEKKPLSQIDKSVIYDNDGNGVGDSLLIVFKDSIDPAALQRVCLQWPPQTFPSKTVTLSSLQFFKPKTLVFTEIGVGERVTVGTGRDTTLFDSSNTSVIRSADVADGIGPLLQKEARLVQRFFPGNDTLFTECTEPVDVQAITGEAFILIKNKGTTTERQIKLKVVQTAVSQGSGQSFMFAAADLGQDAPVAGDYLKIAHTGPVVDGVKNRAHRDNTPVPIVLIKRPPPLDSAAYLDTDANGIVEKIRLFFKEKVDAVSSIKIIATWLTDGASSEAQNGEIDGATVTADIFDNTSDSNLRDRTSGAMKATVTFTQAGSDNRIDVFDRAAPVIVKAVYYPAANSERNKRPGYAKDKLQIHFSEPVHDIDYEEPFRLLGMAAKKPYTFTLRQLQHNGAFAEFEVLRINDIDYPQQGDSIWINERSDVEDIAAIGQKNEHNKKVPLLVISPPWHFILAIFGPANPRQNQIPHELILPDGNQTITTGIFALLEPTAAVSEKVIKEVTVSARIFDALGNIVAENNGDANKNTLLQIAAVAVNGRYKITLNWSGRNPLQRYVGPGEYLLQVSVSKPSGDQQFRGFIGVSDNR
ncbi:MAG: hypothetical protein JW795_16835 [Chitinivibrionales bacterium]|nr:hypothetical protein [Chitinivibrionales bacterium]